MSKQLILFDFLKFFQKFFKKERDIGFFCGFVGNFETD